MSIRKLNRWREPGNTNTSQLEARAKEAMQFIPIANVKIFTREEIEALEVSMGIRKNVQNVDSVEIRKK